MSEDTARAEWVEKTLPALAEVMCDDRLPEGDRYAEAEVRELLTFLYDLDVDNAAGDLTPAQVVLQRLITMQGWEPTTAALLARTLPSLRWGRLEVASYGMSQILGTNMVTLLRNRKTGRVPTKSEHWAARRLDAVIHWMHTGLYILAWKRQHPWSGGPVSGFPEPDANVRS